jgi:PhzF family phenazine biosynthesis protein
MGLPLLQVDAFAEQPFTGNPAAVCLLPGPREERWMQQVAQEMNLSETAFLHRVTGGWRLRWFTPAVEVDLCGHATLAAAHVLWETRAQPPEETIHFHTRSGVLTARRDGDVVEMDFPAEPAAACAAPVGLLEALGVSANFVGKNRVDYLIEAASEEEVRMMDPDFAQLSRLPVRGIIVTASSAAEFDFVSRFFAPAAGILEDPVTGSAHCCLGPYWAERLGRKEMRGYQASSRGGVVGVKVLGERVLLRGRAVTVTRGELLA